MAFVSRICVVLLSCASILAQTAKLQPQPNAATSLQFTTLEVPGSFGTYAEGINNLGDIVGGYTTGNLLSGFVYTGGKFRTISCPNAKFYTRALAINDSGVIVGDCDFVGFVYENGEFTYVAYPGRHTQSTELDGINNQGLIVGGASTGSNKGVVFVYDHGTFSKISSNDYPGGINNANTVASSNCNAHTQLCVGGVYPQAKDGWKKHQRVVYPQASSTNLVGINDNGDLAGVWLDKNGQPGNFVYSSSAKTFTAFVVGTSVESNVAGLNNSGEVVGSYFDGTTYYGFYGNLQ